MRVFLKRFNLILKRNSLPVAKGTTGFALLSSLGKSRSTIGSCGLLVVLGLFYAYQAGYRFNRTASHPIGIYRLVDQVPDVGLYAQFCIPATRAELPPLDEVYVSPCTLDDGGHPLLKRIVRVDKANDAYFVLGDHSKSLDSHIFGPLKRSDITGVLVEVWTF